MTSSTFAYPHTLHTSPDHHLTITARPGLGGQWLVQFMRRGRTVKMLDQCAAWLPAGCWDERRWSPAGHRLVPAAALLEVEQWLRDRGTP